MTPCSLVQINQNSEGTYWLNHQDYKSARRYIPEPHIRKERHKNNLNYQISDSFLNAMGFRKSLDYPEFLEKHDISI
jgi:hypothetical protein